jgi:hypothetical protein
MSFALKIHYPITDKAYFFTLVRHVWLILGANPSKKPTLVKKPPFFA